MANILMSMILTLPAIWSIIFAPPTKPPTAMLNRNRISKAHKSTVILVLNVVIKPIIIPLSINF